MTAAICSDDEPPADADIQAVRSLIQDLETDDAQETPVYVAARVAEEIASEEHGNARQEPSENGPRVFPGLILRIQNYRPERRAVLGTSLVLLVLLQPVFVIGWSLTLAVVAVGLFLVIGEDRFWRGVISRFARYKKRRPDAARRLKLRAWVLARRWDRYMSVLPDQIADTLRSPDLREMIAADRRHAAALDSRLTRLESDRF